MRSLFLQLIAQLQHIIWQTFRLLRKSGFFLVSRLASSGHYRWMMWQYVTVSSYLLLLAHWSIL